MSVDTPTKSKIKSSLKETLVKMEAKQSPFEKALRDLEVPVVSKFLKENELQAVGFEKTNKQLSSATELEQVFPNIIKENGNFVLEAKSALPKITGKRIAVLFSGGPAAGGHNVIAGIKRILGQNNTLYAVNSGPKGLLAGDLFELTDEEIDKVFNLGGFDLMGSDRTKIKTSDQYQKVRKTVKDYNLDGLIIIGGDDSNTNAAFLAEYLYEDGCKVIGVPKTIDGDLQVGDLLPISFGFDTATKIYSELVGNILQDTPSSRKYWHFVKLMGRSASHVALEVALRTRVTYTIISEEIAERKRTINDIVESIARSVAYRAGKGMNYGVVVLPEGLIEFVPELRKLIDELNESMSKIEVDLKSLSLNEKLAVIQVSPESAQLLISLPTDIAKRLFMDRDSHGNLQVSQIPTEKLLIEMTEKKIKEMKDNPSDFFGPEKINLNQEELARFYKFSFKTNRHFFGYEGRCGAPSRFDAMYTYNLGLAAGSLALQGKTGYMASFTNLEKGGSLLAIPLTGLITVERRQGEDEMVIKKALVELDSPAFEYFLERREAWAQEDLFTSPGPRQIWGPTANNVPFTVALNQGFDSLEFSIK